MNIFIDNSLIILSRGVIQTVGTFGMKLYVNVSIRKFLLYIEIVVGIQSDSQLYGAA